MESLKIVFKKTDLYDYMKVSGEIGHYTVCELREAIKERHLHEDGRPVIFDLSEVKYMEESGLYLLIWLLRQKKERSGEYFFGQVILVGCDKNMKTIFNRTGLTHIFPIYETEEDAAKVIAEKNSSDI